MAASPRYKVFRDGVYVASTKSVRDALVLIRASWEWERTAIGGVMPVPPMCAVYAGRVVLRSRVWAGLAHELPELGDTLRFESAVAKVANRDALVGYPHVGREVSNALAPRSDAAEVLGLAAAVERSNAARGK